MAGIEQCVVFVVISCVLNSSLGKQNPLDLWRRIKYLNWRNNWKSPWTCNTQKSNLVKKFLQSGEILKDQFYNVRERGGKKGNGVTTVMVINITSFKAGTTLMEACVCMWTHESSSKARPYACLLYTSPSPRDQRGSRMPSSA